MAGRTVSLSPGNINDQLQALLNRTAAAQNYELERLTVSTFAVVEKLERGLPANETGLSNYYLLFNGWIRWLSEWENYSRNLLFRRRLIGHLNQQLGEGKFTLEIYPFATRLYQIKPERGRTVIQLHECMDYLGETECRKFAQFLRSGRWSDLKQLLTDYHANTPQSKELFNFFRETKANPTHENQTRGRYYDLETVFQNCNQRNFSGKVDRPAVLHWSSRVNHSTMGSYNINEDILMINKGLDSRDVPAYVLDFVMYHELLHKVLGIKTTGSRKLAHTAEFRKLEQAHPDYERAQAFISKRFGKR